MRAVYAFAAGLCAGGCASHESDSRAAALRRAEAIAVHVGAAVYLEAPVTYACGTGHWGDTLRFLYVTARACLSCKDVGYGLRRRPGGALLIVTPREDTPEVCAYLRGERLTLPVVGIGSDVAGRGDHAEWMVYGLLHGPTGRVIAAAEVPDGRALMHWSGAQVGE